MTVFPQSTTALASTSSSSSAASSTVTTTNPLKTQEQQQQQLLQQIVLPNLKYGYRTEPLEWPELQRIIVQEQNLEKLTRNVQQQTEYEFYKWEIQHSWKSVVDHVLVTKFQFEKRIDSASDGRFYAYPSLDTFLHGTPQNCKDDNNKNNNKNNSSHVIQILVKNDFPYYLADNVQHWVLWKLGADCTTDDIERAKEQLKERVAPSVVLDVLHWINPPHVKSLPEIDHVHILVLLQNEEDSSRSSSSSSSNVDKEPQP